VTRLLHGEEFEGKFHTFRSSVFRLETLQVYADSGEDDAISAFERGDLSPPPDPEQDAWEAMIRANRAAGRTMQRVHVVTEPLTLYMQFELAWAYPPNIAAGEDVRVIAAGGGWPSTLPHMDFWLFDDSEVMVARYKPDGSWLGVEQVDDRALLVSACQWRDAALALSMTWAQFMDRHPAVMSRVPVGVRNG